MNRLLIFIVCLFFGVILCSFFGSSISQKRRIASGLAGDLAKKYEKLYGLQFCGISEAAPEGKYENLGINFTIKHIVSKNEARKILLHIQDDFLEAINNNSELKNYLLVYPFTGNNIVITIVVKNRRGYDVFQPDIGSFSIYDNKLRYRYYPEKIDSKPTQPYIELEELSVAEKLVKNNN